MFKFYVKKESSSFDLVLESETFSEQAALDLKEELGFDILAERIEGSISTLVYDSQES